MGMQLEEMRWLCWDTGDFSIPNFYIVLILTLRIYLVFKIKLHHQTHGDISFPETDTNLSDNTFSLKVWQTISYRENLLAVCSVQLAG
jgi:hypothetical protein